MLSKESTQTTLTMKTFCLLLSLCLASSASAYNFGVGTSVARSVAGTSNGAAELAAAPKPSNKPTTISHRRAFLSKIAGATIAAAATTLSPNSASAAEEDNLQNVYWGAGCYWRKSLKVLIVFSLNSNITQTLTTLFSLQTYNMNLYVSRSKY